MMPRTQLIRTLSLASALVLPCIAHGQNDAGGNDPSEDRQPVLHWSFDDSDFTETGPRPPSYPTFQPDNTAARSTVGQPVHTISGKDSAKSEDLRFHLHDEITLEAWVRIESISSNSFDYILGKGRTASSKKNQNYSLRVKGEAGGKAALNFLFSSAPLPDKPTGWHRWTSTDTFNAAGWHHLAVSYTFGKADSIRGYIDGKPVKGAWDLDGATDRAPSVDDDDLILGTGNGNGSSGKTGNAFKGWMDEVAVWRSTLPADVIATRFEHVPPPPAVVRNDVPKGKVLIQICEENIPATAKAWPDEPAKPSETYTERAFGLFEEPHRYISTGVRGERANPHLLRAASVVELPKGKHRLLLRGRGGCRLYIDDKLVMTLPFNTQSSDGHHTLAIQADYLDLGPDFRFAPPGNREDWCEFTSKGGSHFVVLETLVGGVIGKSFRRPELGETVIAWSPEGSEAWQLLTPTKDAIPYSDAGWTAYEAERRDHYAKANAATRAKLRQKSASYWAQRRQAAAGHLASTPNIEVPVPAKGLPANNEIDHFLNAKIARVSTQLAESKGGTVDYFEQIQPILEAKCYSCHQGGKAKGNLRLDELAAALKGGESDGAAITPGKPDHSAILARVTTTDEDDFMPPKGAPLTGEEIALLRTWIREGAHWPEIDVERTELTQLTDDLTFLRRVYLDTVGVPPTLEEIARFQANPDRAAVIETLLTDPRWADHWMGYWQDVLAENPNILNPTLNNSGPFRWWIHESLLDNKPMDLFVTELLRMEGSERFGGPAGFGIASQNDVPMAAKGIIVSSAFLGVEMKCARCHDSPANKSTQEDLFQLAAMLGTKPIKVPASSSVPMDRFHELDRKPLIQVTLQPGSTVEPVWPFSEFCDEKAAALAEHADNPRDVLAALITAPENERFAQVVANRVWARLMGRGIVANLSDWEKSKPTHPGLLRWLGRELVRSGYDLKHVAKLILNSHAYQRTTDPDLKSPSPLFTAPAPRRLQAEQIVDSLFATTGKPFRTEEVSLDIDGARDIKNSISLGQPTRSWMLTSTSNERDRPSLSLPRIQAVCDVLQAFGWRGARQDPISVRDADPNTLQPAILSNGTMGKWLTVLSDDHDVTALAIEAESPEVLIDQLFLKLLTRHPTAEELHVYTQAITPGFKERVHEQETGNREPETTRTRPKYVTWSNHLDPEATRVRQQQEADARRGDPPTQRLTQSWRTQMEDVLWSLLNAPECVFAP